MQRPAVCHYIVEVSPSPPCRQRLSPPSPSLRHHLRRLGPTRDRVYVSVCDALNLWDCNRPLSWLDMNISGGWHLYPHRVLVPQLLMHEPDHMRKIRRLRVLPRLEFCRGPTFAIGSKNWFTFHLWETDPRAARRVLWLGGLGPRHDLTATTQR
jgi:hypothetical protein